MTSDDPSAWIGRSTTTTDTIGLERAEALWASLEAGDGRPETGGPLPPLWHWLYFWDIAFRSELAADGHRKLGGFLPPLGPARRMWAGSRVTFHRPLLIGESASRTSTISDIKQKQGRSGGLTFVTVVHEIAGHEGPAITDEHDIVYREPAPDTAPSEQPAPRPAPEGADRSETWIADPVLLFRYSALTFNGHRIHYDAPYATETEGYPGLIVHGPLLATLMAGAAARHRGGAPLAAFEFRAMSPVFSGDRISVNIADTDEGADVWIRSAAGSYAAKGATRWA